MMASFPKLFLFAWADFLQLKPSEFKNYEKHVFWVLLALITEVTESIPNGMMVLY